MIYFVYKDGEILVETDDLEYVKKYVRENQECSIRDARTGKKIPLEQDPPGASPPTPDTPTCRPHAQPGARAACA